MQLRPRFVGRLGVADAVTVANAVLGFVATLVAVYDLGLAARLILLASIADGLDGVIARVHGSTPLGEYVDSLADVASFSVAPAAFVFWAVTNGWNLSYASPTPRAVAAVAIPVLFVASGVVRLGMYTAYDLEGRTTRGVQTTLAATILAAAYLAGVTRPGVLLGVTAVFAYLMVTGFEYPELSEKDALAMGVIQFGAVVAPVALWRVFPRALTIVALLYLMLAPDFYPRERAEG